MTRTNQVWNPGELVSPLVRDMPPSGIRRFFELASQVKGIISLGIGEPDFSTPWHAREAAVYYLEKGHTSYTSNWGMPQLREEIARYLARQYGLVYSPESQILVTVGVSEAVDLALRAVLCPGDEVIIPEPCYVSYSACTALAGGKPVPVVTRAQDEFRLTPEALRGAITGRTKALLLSYPSNPTGAIMPRAELEEIARVVREHNLLVISDEIYSELTYNGNHTSIASLEGMLDRVILLNGMSKAYAMTGWRIGYAAGPPEIIAAMCKIHQYTIMCAPTQAQYAAIEALKNGEEEKNRMIRSYDQRRRLILRGFRSLGLECFEPRGAFYAFPSIARTGLSSEEFAQRLLIEEKVAVVPGNAFGESGEGHIRCCYAVAPREIEIAVERIGKFLNRIGF
ncbi:MAG: aminotransferase class I/II-fold pyridoxal phosphate-dependent enzyme [Syntrophomonadaceae bacterium]|nr:aminotransferase class I/II-fold pyridoxal phosphate-dependent enzyme [Syntrophomonadaceae bacterium]